MWEEEEKRQVNKKGEGGGERVEVAALAKKGGRGGKKEVSVLLGASCGEYASYKNIKILFLVILVVAGE